MSELLYQSGGVQDLGAAALRRAKAVDLIVLPRIIEGTNCGNCEHFGEHVQPALDDSGIFEGFCHHPAVRQAVTSAMCCNAWNRPGTKRLWEGE